MNGSFGGSFPGDRHGYHRHTQSGTLNQMALDFSSLIQPLPTNTQQSPSAGAMSRLSNGGGGAIYESHDDLCVEQCSGIGLYNGSQFFNHRGPAPAVPQRWPGRTMATHHNPGALFGFASDLDLNAMQFPHELTPPSQNHYQESWFSQQPQGGPGDRGLRGDDASSTTSCYTCDSECTMTGKCSNIACVNKEDICTDQSCPARPGEPEVVNGAAAAAAALISINHAPEQHHGFSLQSSVMDGFDFGLSQTSGQQFMWPPVINNVANHLLSAHRDSSSSNCTRPCILDDPRNYQNCQMPIFDNLDTFNTPPQYRSLNTGLQLNQNLVMCKAEVHDPETYIEHFNQQHRDFLASHPVLQSSLGSAAINHPTVLPSTEELSSSSATPVGSRESSGSDASNTPSPLTPMSNSVDMAEFKEEVSSPPDRSMSELSSGDAHIHRCLWREEGYRDICGQTFSSPEELFNHASNSHIKHAKKGNQGFRCGWDDCPRSTAGAAGFPQRSKIERHMQTHIDHKPHVCHICNKGFSAKQALNQHMLIHTDQKPLTCEICGKAFRYPSALTMHQRVHTGEKPLSCPICGKSFSESSNLSKHKRTHEMRGRFSCPAYGCDRNFHRQDQLRRHMKKHTREGSNGQCSNGPIDDMLATQLESAFEHQAQG